MGSVSAFEQYQSCGGGGGGVAGVRENVGRLIVYRLGVGVQIIQPILNVTRGGSVPPIFVSAAQGLCRYVNALLDVLEIGDDGEGHDDQQRP